jgi:hypothetical protein
MSYSSVPIEYKLRPRQRFGDVELAVEASERHRCRPPKDDLPLRMYMLVEVRLWLRGIPVRPIEIGIRDEQLNELWDDWADEGAAAGWVFLSDVHKLCKALRQRTCTQAGHSS